jgi:hypothetical protein
MSVANDALAAVRKGRIGVREAASLFQHASTGAPNVEMLTVRGESHAVEPCKHQRNDHNGGPVKASHAAARSSDSGDIGRSRPIAEIRSPAAMRQTRKCLTARLICKSLNWSASTTVGAQEFPDFRGSGPPARRRTLSRYPCRRVEDAWRNVETNEVIEADVAGWRQRRS